MSTEIVKQGGALAIQPDQTDWTPAQAAVLQQSGIDDDVTGAELSGFLHLCQRTKLDPFSRQIYLIGRKDKRAGRKVFTPQTGIDGYRVIAHRVIAETREAFGYEDTLWCDTSGRWRDVWLANEAPAAAKVTVLRNGQRFSAVALYREYVQTDYNGNPTRMWKNMGANQIAKCAEALALRKAFPHDLAGVYTAEEMAQADNPEPHLRAVSAGPQVDQWSTPAPSAQQRDFVAEARAASDADEVRRIWSEAKAAGLDETRLGHIAAVGKSLTAQPTPKPAEADEPIEGEVLSPEESAARDAERELRDWATANGIEDIDTEAEAALTMPLRMAPAGAIRGLLSQLRGDHAAA